MRLIFSRRSLFLAILLFCIAAPLGLRVASANITNNPGNGNVTPFVGTLSTFKGSSIPAADVASWIAKYIPAASQQLVILTECFGGNALAYIPAHAVANLAVMSATSQNQLAIYGGFDSGSSGALAPYTPPAPATSAKDVFTAGVNSAIANTTGETPINTDGNAAYLATTAFPLISTNANAAVAGRQILVYAGKPDGGKSTNDVFQFNTIKTNFAGEANTTVTGVGSDSSAAPWTGGQGTAAGLQTAIKSAGTVIANAAAPAKQQFILDVGDHGGVRNVAAGLNRSAGANASPTNAVPVPVSVLPLPDNPAVPQGGRAAATLLVSNFNTLPTMPVNPNFPIPSGQEVTGNVDVTPSFSVLLPLHDLDPDNNNAQINDPLNGGIDLTNPPDLIDVAGNPRDNLILGLVNINNKAPFPVLYFQSTYETTYIPSPDDLNVDAGLRVHFQLLQANGAPIPTDDPNFDAIFFNQTYNVYLLNYTANAWDVGEFAQDNPSVPAPEPATVLIGALPLWMIGSRRRQRASAASCA